jgi:hypothetical protein
LLPQLVLGIAGHPLETLVRHQITSVLKIEHCDADRGGLEHGSPTLFAGAQSFLGVFAIGNIYNHRSKESWGAIRLANDERSNVSPNDLPVLAKVTLFKLIETPRTSDDAINVRFQCCAIASS